MTSHAYASDWLPPGLFEHGQLLADAINNRVGCNLVDDIEELITMFVRLDGMAGGGVVAPAQIVSCGDGFLCVDLGPDDVETWQTFSSLITESDPELVATAAQEWRLPVTPFRRRCDAKAPVAITRYESSVYESSALGDLTGKRVVDLTSLWAGPLCTSLLAAAGAEVIKIDSQARPDGLRGTAMYNRLNDIKQIVDLDLRDEPCRRQFDDLLASSDLLVTSLSPRALANLELMPGQSNINTLAITAFDADTDEADWIAYGTGVHATSGLGWQSDDESPTIPAFSYPDPLAGLLACLTALGLLADGTCQNARVSLAAAVAPLLQMELLQAGTLT